MIQSSGDNVHVEVRVKGELSVSLDGKEDYHSKFDDFMHSFIDREIIPIHVFSPKSEFTLYGDGYVSNLCPYVLGFNFILDQLV